MELEFVNNNPYPIQIKGPNGGVVNLKSGARKVLDEWFKRYSPRFITLVENNKTISKQPTRSNRKLQNPPNKKKPKLSRPSKNPQINKRPTDTSLPKDFRERLKQKKRRRIIDRRRKIEPPNKNFNRVIKSKRRIVGTKVRQTSKAANKHLNDLLEIARVPISNDIGVGVLSFNRLGCVKRLIQSIRKYTNLNRTTVIVSDESTDINVTKWLKEQNDIITLSNKNRLGVAGQTNRLLRCLKRFKYKLILNDDVEILKSNWETLYFSAMKSTGYHHFCMQMPGVYGSKEAKPNNVKGVAITTIDSKPHGAVLALDDVAFNKVGYFDERFGIYGMEHVDWSRRVSLSKIQPPGYHDLAGSDAFFRIHGEQSAVDNTKRLAELQKSRQMFENIKNNANRIFVEPSAKSDVPEVSYIIPFQVNDRSGSIRTVINCIKAQRFPAIQIIASEQDTQKRIGDLGPVDHILVPPNSPGDQFNKSAAFNMGVKHARNKCCVLHDADMIVHDNYTNLIVDQLDRHDSCHICSYVSYLDINSTNVLNSTGILDRNSVNSTHVINYFEGGSIGITREAYFKIGGFDEKFVGYGVEDCEFYERMSKCSNFREERSVTLIHLAHGRTPGWEACHENNKKRYTSLQRMALATRISKLRNYLQNKG